MAKRIAKPFIDTLLSRVDIVGTIHQRVPLKKAGKDMQACCPFHNEKTPSFSVVPQKQFYYCFGCGAKGNAIGFLMEYEHLSFVDAVEKLADENGISVEYEQFDEVKAQRRKDAYDVLNDAAALYENNLFAGVGLAAREYLAKRQLDEETSRFFRLGYSQAGNHLVRHFAKEHSSEALKNVGLLGQGDSGFYDQFRDRLMFPIRDQRGRVLGFGARALGDAMPKYLNSGETEVFSKRYVLYGLYEELQSSREIEHLIVVEGYMDVIALHQMGVRGAVAALGTAFTAEHIELVRRYTKKLFICFDGDKAGRKAAQRAMDAILPVMTPDMGIRVVFLPEGEDPDTLVRKIGREAFSQQLDDGLAFSEFVFQSLIADADLSQVEDKGGFVQRAKALFDALADSDYKGILYQGLVERVGFDIYRLSQSLEQQPTEFNHQKQHKTIKRNRGYGYQSTSEGRLIRLLLEMPSLAGYVKHLSLLSAEPSADRLLLQQLVQFCQIHSLPAERMKEAVLTVFDEESVVRLQTIFVEEKIVEQASVNETIEARRARFKTEFLQGFSVLLTSLQRKTLSNRLKFSS